MNTDKKDYTKSIEKRKATILKKRLNKETKKVTNQEKIVKKHEDHLTNLKDVKNKNAYAKILEKFKKFKNKHIVKTGARYKNSDVIGITVHERMDKADILKYVNSLSKDLGKINKNGLIDLSVRGNTWLYGGQSTWGSNIVYSDEYDQINDDEYDSFSVYFSALPEGFMGNNSTNDCLYYCLLECIGKKLLKIWAEAIDLKRFLKIPYYQKVSIADLEKIEQKINVPINVTGDFCYTSHLTNPLKAINLNLINEHCTLCASDKATNLKINSKVSFRDRTILMYDTVKDKQTGKFFMCYDGKTKFQLSKELRADVYNWKTNYILVSRTETPDKKLSLEESYVDFIKIANTLKEKTDGKINLYRTGNFKTTALNLFNDFTKHLINPDNIKQREAQMVNNASQGAIIFTTKEFKGVVHKADVISMYPSILNSGILFPMKEGELKYIKEFGDFFQYGIYRAIINPSLNDDTNKLFRFNYDNTYTHFDMSRAKELNLKIELIIDDQPNFLYYSRDKCLTGTEIFGQYVDYLFPLKVEGISGAKQILNVLWGALCQRNMKKLTHKHGEDIHIPDNVIPKFKPCDYDENTTLINYVQYDKQNKFGWARIKPFLLAKGRITISKIMEPYKNILVRCHTDGVYFSEEPKDIKYGCQLGDLRFEGIHDIYINSSGTVKVNN